MAQPPAVLALVLVAMIAATAVVAAASVWEAAATVGPAAEAEAARTLGGGDGWAVRDVGAGARWRTLSAMAVALESAPEALWWAAPHALGGSASVAHWVVPDRRAHRHRIASASRR